MTSAFVWVMGGENREDRISQTPLSSWVMPGALYTGSCATFLHATDIKCVPSTMGSHSVSLATLRP